MQPPAVNHSIASADQSDIEMRARALFALALCDPAEKCGAVATLAQLPIDPGALYENDVSVPGRPALPLLVHPSQVARRSMATPEGRAALLHALAHIEFNAINLALDIIWRFPGMPQSFYIDWCQVAVEEAKHFGLLCERLAELGCRYGDFTAHDGLWEMAEKTRGDLMARLALVPRTLEARGLDVSPSIRDKLAQAGDHDSAAVLEIILRDEVGHVAIGNHWFKWVCEREGAEPVEAYERLARTYQAPRLRGPFNLEARRKAGFDDVEIEALLRMAKQGAA